MANKLMVVIPCYNEEEVLPETSRRLVEKMASLVEKGLIIDKVAESERKAEAARLAAEEAEAAAQQAIDEAIKAKEDAEKAAARAEQTADEIEAAEQAKAAKAEEA